MSLIELSRATCSRLLECINQTTGWFRRSNLNGLPHDLQEFADAELLYISTKQVPSATSIVRPGSRVTTKNRDMLRSMGIPLLHADGSSDEEFVADQKSEKREQTLSSQLSVINSIISGEENPEEKLARISRMTSSLSELPQWEDQEEDNEDPQPLAEDPQNNDDNDSRHYYRINYIDYWKVMACRTYLGFSGGKQPKTLVVQGDNLRIQDPLPKRILRKGASRIGRRIRFIDIADISIKMDIICRRTFWGKLAYSWSIEHSERDVHLWAKRFLGRIRALLEGRSDPLWSKERTESIYANPLERRKPRSRSMRLIEVLKTVNGMFAQRYLAYPEEYWTWEKFDMFVLSGISHLIGDEFLDGELKSDLELPNTHYEMLKQARKVIKEKSFQEGKIDPDTIQFPGWLTYLKNVFLEVSALSGEQRAQAMGTLRQTRGCGTPPPIISLKAKEKALKTFTLPSDPPKSFVMKVVRDSCASALNKIPDHAFTGLSTKGAITVTTAASWEYTRKECGTLSAIKDLIWAHDIGVEVPIRDLNNGKVIHMKDSRDMTIGEHVFWESLDKLIHTTRDEISSVKLVVVKEPGKSRIVTKGPVALKVILDFVNHIVSEPLKKGIRSSHSGMGQSNHGWNFFKSFFAEGTEEILFHPKSVVEEKFAGYSEVEYTYDTVFVASTDYETATDYMSHWVAREIGNQWMIKCGIPLVLRKIVNDCCYRPRYIYFQASGPLTRYGELVEGNTRRILAVRGILMGDPLTKPILHMINVCNREFATNVTDIRWWRSSSIPAQLVEAARSLLEN